MPNIEKRWKKNTRKTAGILLLVYSIGFFAWLTQQILGLILVIVFGFLISAMFGLGELFFIVLDFYLDTIFHSYMLIILFIILLIFFMGMLFFASISLLELRKRKFVTTVISVNLFLHLFFPLFTIYITIKEKLDFNPMVTPITILPLLILGLGLFSLISSWDSFMSKDEWNEMKRRKKIEKEELKKRRQVEKLYKDSYTAFEKSEEKVEYPNTPPPSSFEYYR